MKLGFFKSREQGIESVKKYVRKCIKEICDNQIEGKYTAEFEYGKDKNMCIVNFFPTTIITNDWDIRHGDFSYKGRGLFISIQSDEKMEEFPKNTQRGMNMIENKGGKR